MARKQTADQHDDADVETNAALEVLQEGSADEAQAPDDVEQSTPPAPPAPEPPAPQTASESEAVRDAEMASAEAAATNAQPIDPKGFALDAWGLPFAGPERMRRLAEMKRADPALDDSDWSDALTTAVIAQAMDGDAKW